MRLVDADKLKERFNSREMYTGALIKEFIDTQSTAYYVDNVVEEIENEIEKNPYQSEYLAGLYKALGVVKEGAE
jgi:hypothetical protein